MSVSHGASSKVATTEAAHNSSAVDTEGTGPAVVVEVKKRKLKKHFPPSSVSPQDSSVYFLLSISE